MIKQLISVYILRLGHFLSNTMSFRISFFINAHHSDRDDSMLIIGLYNEIDEKIIM